MNGLLLIKKAFRLEPVERGPESLLAVSELVYNHYLHDVARNIEKKKDKLNDVKE